MGLLTTNLAVLEADPGLVGVSFIFSAASTYEHGSPPRCAWIPTTDTWSAAEAVETASGEYEGYKSVKTRNAAVEAHLWGANYDQAEAMLHNLVAALHKYFPCVHSIQPAKWGQLAKDGVMGLGWIVLLPISFEIPVLDEPISPAVFADRTSPVVNPPPAGTEVIIEHGEITSTDFQ